MNRISRLDDISIEIDNFDVDLLSARTLNITGVLSLRGISASPVQEPEEIWREEPFTVVHQREAYDEQASHFFHTQNAEHEHPYIPEESYFAAQEDHSFQQRPEMSDEAETTVTISSAFDTGWSSSQLFAGQAHQAEEEAEEVEEEVEDEEEAREEEQEITLASQQTNDEGWLATSQAFANFSADHSHDEASFPDSQQANDQERTGPEASEQQIAPVAGAFSAQEPVPAQDKPELRIGVAGKQPQESGGLAADVGIHTLLQTSKREQAARQAAEKVVAQQRAVEEAKAQASGDEIEWKNLFLGKRSEDTEFRKIRVCIVQRDETLDVIASRYSLHPRDILNYNRLDDSGVSEGQLLYIP
jgi:stage VI sporulation protein D